MANLSLELIGRKQSKKHQAVEAGTEIEIALSNVEKANWFQSCKGWCRA